MNLLEILSILRERKDELAEKFAVVKIGIYGSFVRGEGDEKSDIDVYVEFDMSGLSFDKYLEFVDYLERLFGRKVDVITKDGVESIRIPHVKEEIKRSIVYV